MSYVLCHFSSAQLISDERFKPQVNSLSIPRVNDDPFLLIAPLQTKPTSISSASSDWSEQSDAALMPNDPSVRSKVIGLNNVAMVTAGNNLITSRPGSEVTGVSKQSFSSSGYNLSVKSQGHHSDRSRSLTRSQKSPAKLFEDIRPISRSEAELFETSEPVTAYQKYGMGYPDSMTSGQSLRIKSVGSQKMTVKSGVTSDMYRVTSSETLPTSLLTKTRRSSSLTNLSQFQSKHLGDELNLHKLNRPSSAIITIEIDHAHSDLRANKINGQGPSKNKFQPISIPVFPKFGKSRYSSRASSAVESFTLKSGWSYKSDDGQLSVSKCICCKQLNICDGVIFCNFIIHRIW